MIAKAYKTKKVMPGDNLEEILIESLPTLQEDNVVIITSKIVALAQNRVVSKEKIAKEKLVRREAELVLINKPLYERAGGTLVTISNSIFNMSAGIDESNGNAYFVLWPKDPIQAATEIWKFLRKKYNIQNLGVIIVDSCFMPLRAGSIGVGLGWCGFIPVNSYIGKTDIFGDPIKYTRQSMIDTLASVGSIMMGETNEQSPLAVIKDIPGIVFIDRAPNKEEITLMKPDPSWDMYSSMILAAPWEKGSKGSTEVFKK